MRNCCFSLLLFILALLQCNTMNAQKQADLWRITKKIKTENNGQKFTYEYAYSSDGRIQTVKYLLASGATNITIDNFTFSPVNKPSAYTVTYNREGIQINVSLRYDNSGRVTHVVKTNNPQDITTFTYRYAGNTVIVTEKKTTGESSFKDNKITLYTEYGDFEETISDAATQVITSTITLKGKRDASLEPYPDNFMGGFEPPMFLGVTAYGSEPQTTATKNNDGLITSLTLVTTSGTRKIEYVYSKIGASTPDPVETGTPVIIYTNITCAAGKNNVEALLKRQDGVVSAVVDIKTGKLSLTYSTDGTPYTEIISLINEAGFDADRNRSSNPAANPCITAPAAKTISIQTNISCAEGKQVVERILADQQGISKVSVDIQTGKLSFDYSTARPPLADVVKKVNDAGFNANKTNSPVPELNPCVVTPTNPATIIQTNINCAEGKTKIETLLKEQDGVTSAVVDIGTGKLSLNYSTDGTPYTEIIRLINNEGFDADRKKSPSPDKNPCSKTPEPVEKTTSIIIQTNINCDEGKQKVESLLKQQKGVVNVKADFRTGKLEIEYNKDGIASSQIIRLINQAGFDVDKTKSANPENNPCIKKPTEGGDKPYVVKPPEKIPKEVAQLKFSTIQGKLFYRYKKDAEQPVSNNLGLGATFKKVKVGNTTINVIDTENPYPDFTADQRFPKTNDNGTQPLKKAKISLIYSTLYSESITPSKYEEFNNSGFIELKLSDPLNKYWQQNNYVIASGETDATGNFSFTFLNNLATGYLGGFKGYVFTDKNLKEVGDFHMHGTLRIIINEDDFYSPEILLFPKPGQTVKIPDDVALVNSFDLIVTVRSHPLVYDQAVGLGNPLSDYPVTIGRLQSKLASDAPSTPFEANQLDKKGLTGTALSGGAYKIFDGYKTLGDGTIEFKNLCANNEHLLQATADEYKGFVYEKQDKYLPVLPGVNAFPNFNSNLVVQKRKEQMLLSPKLPEIYVTVNTRINGKTEPVMGADVTLYNYYAFEGNNGKEAYTIMQHFPTDAGGHLQLKDLPVQIDKVNGEARVVGPARSLVFMKPGYGTKELPGTGTKKLQWGERWPGNILEMFGTAKLLGKVVNESGERMVAEIKVADGPSVKTKVVFGRDGIFFLDNVPAGNKITVEINPAGDQYFSETLVVDIPAGKTTDLGTIIVKEKLHRAVFKIVDQNNKPVYDAWVSINNSTTKYSTGKDGTTSNIEIASPGDNFNANVNVKADGFLAYDDYVSIPRSKEPKKITIKLIKGKLISGYVKDAETKQPISKARVYTISGYNEDGAIEVETFTDDKGHYELKGVSKAGYFLNPGTFKVSSDQVTVYAVKSGNPGYIQEQRSAKGDNVTEVNFELQRFNCNSEIWGLPVEITSVEKKGKGFSITGAFIKLPANATFKPLENTKLPFRNVMIAMKQAAGKPGELKTDKCTMEPVENTITTEVSEIKIIAFDHFNCALTGSPQGRGYENLVISKSKTGSCGILSGFVQSKLDYFEFSDSYTGSFTLQPFIDKKPTGNNLFAKNYLFADNVMIEVLGADNCIDVKDKYSLSTEENITSFYVHDFKASIRNSDSYLVRDTFSLGTDIELNIPLVKNKKLDVGSIKVIKKGIIPPVYKGEVNIAVEKWNIKGNGLEYINEQGGFKIIDAVLQTNLPELPLKTLILTPTNLDPGQDNIDPSKEITLAGVAPLTLNKAVPALVLEQSAPHDHKQHWRLNLYNTTNAPVAYLQNIPGLADNDRIAINLFVNYSDGEKKLVLDGVPHMFYNVVQQTVDNIEIGKDFFTLIGNTDLKIPNNNTNITGRFKYMKEKGEITFTAEKLNTDVELSGKVSFAGNQVLTDPQIKKGITNFELREGYFEAKGTAIIYDNEKGKGTDIPLSARIIKENGTTRMELDKDKPFPPTSGSQQKMIITKGKAEVNNNKWENLKFTTRLEGYEVVQKGQDLIDFEVKGAIESDKNGNKLQMDGLTTPFGDLSVLFDFDNKSFNGNLHFVDAHLVIPPGLFTLNTGDAEVQIDSKGFIIVGAFSEVDFNPVPILNPFQCGIALGVYTGPLPATMLEKLRNVTIRKQIPEELKNGLIGAYIGLAKSFHYSIGLPDKVEKYIPEFVPIPKASIDAGLDITSMITLSKGGKIVVTGYGTVAAEASIGCFGLTGNGIINPKFEWKQATKELTLGSYQEIGLGVKACIGSLELTLGLNFGLVDNKFELSPTIK